MKKIIVFFILLYGNQVAAAQDFKVSGMVVSSLTGLPLQGASILVKGQTIGITNKEGTFNITLAAGEYASFSHMGYAQQQFTPVAGKLQGYIIQMNPTSATMEEVTISTGYQLLPRERATGSFEKTDMKLFNRVVSPDALGRLEGLVSGLYFSKVSGPPEINIRGLSTISGSRAPLIVLDNFPYEGDINNINPNDIESVTLLKDAAAASIWGARSANGVIVITTKKGRYGQKFSINVTANTSIEGKPRLMDDPNFMDAIDFIAVESFLFGKGFYNSNLNNTGSRPIISPVVEILAKRKAGLISAADSAMQVGAFLYRDVRYDYLNNLFQRGIRQQYALNFSGGSNAINWVMGLGYDKTESNIIGNNNRRISLNTTSSIKLTSRLEVQAGFSYTHQLTNMNGLRNANPSSKALYPYARLADENGNALSLPKDYRESYLDTAGAGLLMDWKYRPLDEIRMADNTQFGQDLLFKLGMRYNIAKEISAEVKGQVEKGNSTLRNYYSPDTYFTRNLVNRYSQRTGNSIKYIVPKAGILDKTNKDLDAWALRGQLNYAGKGKGDHRLNAIAGAEIRELSNDGESYRTYGYNESTLNFSMMDYLTKFPIYGNLSGNSTIPANGFGFTETVSRLVSVYANAGYFFKNKYGITASARRDASNLFGVATNNKWSPFWSGGLSWDIQREPFFKIKQVQLLKLRATYGYNGNINNGIAAVPTISYIDNQSTNLPGANVSSLTNAKLRWERSGILNLGLDFKMLNERLNGSIEYYDKKSTDLISPAPIDPTTGLGTMRLNVANLNVKGWDIQLEVIPVNKKVRWSSSVMFSYVQNKVTKYLLENTINGSTINNGYAITPRVGKDPYAIISFKYQGLDSIGNPVGYLNGVASKDYTNMLSKASWDDLQIHGSSRPPYFGSWINTFSYKGFSLTAQVQYKFGYYFRRNTISYYNLYNGWAMHRDYYRRWQKPGDELITDVPAMNYPANNNRDRFYQNSTATVSKADHIRLHDISLSYDPQGKLATSSLLKGLQLYCYASNLGIIWRANEYGLDPDYGNDIPASMLLSFGLRKAF